MCVCVYQSKFKENITIQAKLSCAKTSMIYINSNGYLIKQTGLRQSIQVSYHIVYITANGKTEHKSDFASVAVLNFYNK